MHLLLRLSLLVCVAATAIPSWAGPSNRPEDRRREGDLKVGDPAPDFTVQDLQGQQSVKLSALRGKPVALIFGSCT